jgi:hypothetical protein
MRSFMRKIPRNIELRDEWLRKFKWDLHVHHG